MVEQMSTRPPSGCAAARAPSRYSDSGARSVHPDLDPFDVGRRESRDSDEHPQSLAIAVLFDVTGSMGGVPRTLQKKLPKLLGLLKDSGYVSDPQLMFGAIGDATCDRAPLQVGQFESDNRMDGDLERILLEGGGGGQKTESYELAMYFMARHTATDCFEKRGKRGYLFIIGDEMPYPPGQAPRGQRLDRRRAAAAGRRSATWSRSSPGAGTPTTSFPRAPPTRATARCSAPGARLLGQNVIELADLDAVCETIALTVGLGEEAIDLDEGLADLRGRRLDRGPDRRARPGGHRRLPRGHRRPPRRPAGGPGAARPARLRRNGTGSDSRTRPGADGLDFPSWQRAAVNGHVIVVDLGYGDAGKGDDRGLALRAERGRARRRRRPGRSRRWSASTAARRPRTTCSRGRTAQPHAFAQFGSGTFTRGTRTFLSRFMLVDPLRPGRRGGAPRQPRRPDPFGLVAIDRDALLTTPYHRAANQAREAARGAGRHGSCGMGIGETAATRSPTRKTRPAPATSRAPRALTRKLALLRDRLADSRASGAELAALPDRRGRRRAPGGGGRGRRLPRRRRPGDPRRRRLPGGPARAGPGRLRGRPGRAARRVARLPPVHDLVDDDVRERGNAAARGGPAGRRDQARRHPRPTRPGTARARSRPRTRRCGIPEPHNADGRWQGPFRAGHLDALALRYAAEVAGGVDAVALTHLDTARRHAGRAADLPRLPTSPAAACSGSSPARPATWPTRSRSPARC